ncbi:MULTISPECIES: hypothetical protein [Candidatus Rhabdochlamydia]|uniref:hypothetical protein n=1 Tax=Candidatus Rhabdochlamydia TaxID=292833 RepID=UPI001BFC94DD|nr:MULTISPECIES: hypothetical protein [Rhabdochlamydia]
MAVLHQLNQELAPVGLHELLEKLGSNYVEHSFAWLEKCADAYGKTAKESSIQASNRSSFSHRIIPACIIFNFFQKAEITRFIYVFSYILVHI